MRFLQSDLWGLYDHIGKERNESRVVYEVKLQRAAQGGSWLLCCGIPEQEFFKILL